MCDLSFLWQGRTGGRKLRTGLANTPGSLRCAKPPACVSGKDTVVKVWDVWAQGGIVGGWITALWSRRDNRARGRVLLLFPALSYRTALRKMNEWEAEVEKTEWTREEFPSDFFVHWKRDTPACIKVLPPVKKKNHWSLLVNPPAARVNLSGGKPLWSCIGRV